MARRVWIVSKGTVIDEQVIQDATVNNCSEIARGIPPALQNELRFQKLPLAYEEPERIQLEQRDLAKEIDEIKSRLAQIEKL